MLSTRMRLVYYTFWFGWTFSLERTARVHEATSAIAQDLNACDKWGVTARELRDRRLELGLHLDILQMRIYGKLSPTDSQVSALAMDRGLICN